MSPELSKSNYIMHFSLILGGGHPALTPSPHSPLRALLIISCPPPFMKILDVPLIYVDTEQFCSLISSQRHTHKDNFISNPLEFTIFPQYTKIMGHE